MSTQPSPPCSPEPISNIMETAETFASSMKKTSQFWFFDGNIVLLTWPNIVFRVHKGVLALHSEFFRNMFQDSSEVPPHVPHSPNDRSSWRIEGCPIICLPDGTSDIWELLRVVYGQRRELKYPVDVSFETVAALIRVGDKYGVHRLVAECKPHLVHMVPRTLDDYARASSHRFSLLYCPHYAIEAVNVFRLLDMFGPQAPHITSFLLFLCTQLDEKKICTGTIRSIMDLTVDRLSDEDKERVLALKRELKRRGEQAVAALQEPSAECRQRGDLSMCTLVYERLILYMSESYIMELCEHGGLFRRDIVQDIYALMDSAPWLCVRCVQSKAGALVALQEETWRLLPVLAGVLKEGEVEVDEWERWDEEADEEKRRIW
ncbi:hypothetical protein K466DRAFT_230679 [Polyporus arcularius HHB13444]|uniref:BTB domain-containing protein n=1 Tax=Polyporus arcularius HHB13444 TaxID=1314778 RepID=A0A5C3P5I8_9APHY|nr:hypothetical protein K466DRAFT_230679 [Polyporus arcularius HHB13444]